MYLFACLKQFFVCVENICIYVCTGYFRFVFKASVPARLILGEDKAGEDDTLPVVLKIMKPRFYGWIGDWLRHIRESIMLHYMAEWEQEFMDEFGPTFESWGQPRAFHYVPEWGHCIYPTYISVTPFYEMPLDKFIMQGNTRNMTLKEVTEFSLQILQGLQALHNIPGLFCL